ncbi:MAG: NADH-quinone oxidoreductase subunit NuoE [Candidatus Bipolaricaulota bacterium]|nr:NADH-quinone oxidoreductase subunit NuoE [Candidatus Bipolaricaulota bacterium]MDW8126460.1 NADH-quinone oxidoreductase subunit NuoE [Candidatus Bipolaricaulota bacterium]
MNRIAEQVREIVQPYAGKPAELIQALHRIQSTLGYLPREAQEVAAEALGVPLSQVRGVVTFYHLFRTRPAGKHTIRVCMGTACHVRGAERILAALKEELGIGPGETTADRKISLELVRCLGCCGLAPVMMVDEDVFGRLDPKKARRIVQEIRDG